MLTIGVTKILIEFVKLIYFGKEGSTYYNIAGALVAPGLPFATRTKPGAISLPLYVRMRN